MREPFYIFHWINYFLRFKVVEYFIKILWTILRFLWKQNNPNVVVFRSELCRFYLKYVCICKLSGLQVITIHEIKWLAAHIIIIVSTNSIHQKHYNFPINNRKSHRWIINAFTVEQNYYYESKRNDLKTVYFFI